MTSPSLQDLLNFDDPLNLEAAEHYQKDKVGLPSSAVVKHPLVL